MINHKISKENLKIAWAVEAGTEDYIIGCIRFAQRMKYLKSKYPVLILVANNINKEKLNLFKYYNIEYQLFKSDEFLTTSLFTSALIEPLNLNSDWDFIVNLEPDMVPLNRDIDTIITNNQAFLYSTEYNLFSNKGSTGVLGIKPSIQCFNDIRTNFLDNTPHPQVLESYLTYNYLYNNLNINRVNFKSSLLGFKSSIIAHFPGKYKQWNSLSPDFTAHFLNDNYLDFNTYIDLNQRYIKYLSILTNILYISDIPSPDNYGLDNSILKNLIHNLQSIDI